MLGPEDIKKQKIDNPEAFPDKPTEDVPVTLPNTGSDTILKSRIAEILGEHPQEVGKFDTELNRIAEYAKERASNIDDMLWEIRELAARLGSPAYGENRIKFIYQYLYLIGESRQITEKIRKMEKLNA